MAMYKVIGEVEKEEKDGRCQSRIPPALFFHRSAGPPVNGAARFSSSDWSVGVGCHRYEWRLVSHVIGWSSPVPSTVRQ